MDQEREMIGKTRAAAGVVAVKNMFGDRFHVLDLHLMQGRRNLRLYSPETGEPLSSRDGQEPVVLVSANICPHPESEFVAVSVLGSRWMECPSCRAERDAAVARRLSQCDRALAVDGAAMVAAV